VSPYTFNYSLSQLIFTAAGSFDWIVQGQTRGPHFFNAFNGDGKRFEDRGPQWGISPIDGDSLPIEDTRTPEGLAACTAADMANPGVGVLNTCQQYTAIAGNIQRFNDRVPTYTTVNISIGWKRTDGMMSIRGFVNNVFDVVYPTNIISQSGFHSRFYNDPRMAGVRMRLDF
jgi:outer membrane receptor protein involved in Fe transport